MLISRIIEGKRNNKNRKKRKTRITTDFEPLHIIALITNQFDFISVIHLLKVLLRINRTLDLDFSISNRHYGY